jgi:Methylamine utilisation protein MauE
MNERSMRFVMDLCQNAIVIVLTFAGAAKLLPEFMSTSADVRVSAVGSTWLNDGLRAASPWVGALELILATILVFWASATILSMVGAVAMLWGSVTACMVILGGDGDTCGCLGPRIRLDLVDHALLASGVLLLCRSITNGMNHTVSANLCPRT